MYKKHTILFVSAILLFLAGCSNRTPAPIFDGAYLKYTIESDYLTIKFSQLNSKYFEVILFSSDEDMLLNKFSKAKQDDGKVLVDKFMKRRSGKLLELKGIVGPVWIPQALRKKGRNEGIDLIFSAVQTDEVKEWRGRQVYAVTASLFRGAVSGTWYYDVNSGFLVGCNSRTVLSDFLSSGKDTPEFVLVESNIKELALPLKTNNIVGVKTLPEEQVNKSNENISPSEIKIDGFMTSGDENAVLIGDDVYQIGDIIGGVKIINISLDSMEVLEDGKVRTIR